MSVILKIGSSGFVTIDGDNYERGYLAASYATISGVQTLGILVNAENGPKWLYYPNPYTEYLDGDNSDTPFASMAALHSWMDTNFEASGGGGGGAPSGPAGGDLAGTYPNPNIAKYYTLTALLTSDGSDSYTFTIPTGYLYCVGLTAECTAGAAAGDKPLFYDVSISGTTLTVYVSGLIGTPVGRDYNIRAILSK